MSQSRSLASLTSYLETLPEPHILCDRSYRVVAANAAYRARCRGAAVVGQTCYRASHRYSVPCDRVGEDCPVKESLETGVRATAIHRHFRDSGETFERIDVSPVRDGSGEIAWFIERVEEVSTARGLTHAQGFIGASARFTAMLDAIARVAPSNAVVLLLGESGAGKELAAKAVHDLSRRASGPFVAIDCSGLPETLFESELFGHEKGAFTGAVSRKFGLIEQAAGGTLFVDEVGDIPLALQVKLLRLLETGTFRRVGGSEPRRADFRLVSATHRSLKRMVADGAFRQDLFYRLSTFPIRLPRCANGGTTSPPSSQRCSGASLRTGNSRFRRPPWLRSPPTTGRATCASCVTPSSAQASCATATSSSRSTCPTRCAGWTPSRTAGSSGAAPPSHCRPCARSSAAPSWRPPPPTAARAKRSRTNSGSARARSTDASGPQAPEQGSLSRDLTTGSDARRGPVVGLRRRSMRRCAQMWPKA